MTNPPGGESLARPALLWASAAVLAVAAHAGAAAWALRHRPEPVAESAPPAMMIELAPEILSPPAEIEEIAPDMVEAPENLTTGVELTEATPIEPPPPLDPPPLLEEPPPDVPPPPTPEPPLPQPPQVETPPQPAEVVEPPTARPPDLRLEQPPDPPKEVVEKKPPPAPSKAAVKAKAIAPPAETAAAPSPTPSAGGSGAVSPAKWQARLMAHLERRKRYPSGARKRGEEGVAHVHFSIDDSGNVRSVRLSRSSGFPELDAEVVALVRRASPVPAPPPGAPRDITAPVQFNIR
ncbi:energy transducer TonB [Amaricoccus sp.]|uniref:energy transducer TonB n=1 Tax=Amaricoccus sp. TaxID=1872485 RepID=UPI001B61D88F|nr:TonB family protein [Amaricoccus sp.]MBP7000373.1 energy transducer TonB [Amaricoccus sp.]